MVSIKTIIVTIGAPILVYLATLFAQPVYESLWLRYITSIYVLIDLKYLGYTFFVFCGFGAILVLFSNKENHPHRRYFGMWIFLFCLIAGLNLAFPWWFRTQWVI